MTGPAIRGLLLACGITLPLLAGPVTIVLACRDEAPCAIGGKANLRSVADRSVTRTTPIANNRATFAEPAGTDWELSIDAPGFWAPAERVTFTSSEPERHQSLRMWRTGRVRATISAKEAPAAVRLAVTSPPHPGRAPEIPQGTSFDCTSAKPAEWTCEVAAATLDLAVRSDGYAPHYIWDARVSPGETLNLGEVALKRGGALLAWLDPDARKHDETVHAILRREMLPAESATAVRVSEPVARGTFSAKGVVHLAPIPAGRYVLETRADGYVPTLSNVEIFEGKESSLRRLIELRPAFTVRLRIDPPLAPGGAPWQVETWRPISHGTGSESAGSGPASQEGLFEAVNQAEGPLRVLVRDSRRNLLASRELTIVSGGGDYTVKLDLATLTGSVTLGGTKLPGASLLFGGSGGAAKIRAKADEEGRFEVTLPRVGAWLVDVTEPRAAVATSVKVSIPDGAESVRIELPDHEISGWVRDSEGQRLPNATVELFVGSVGVQTRPTDSSGVFRFRGVPPGVAILRATDPRTKEYSAESRVTLSEGGNVENVELNIESLRGIHGFVRSGGVPVPGARLNAYAFLGNTAQQQRVTTDLQGRFSLDIPLASPNVTLIVGIAGRTLHPFTVVPTAEGVVVDVAPAGGELRLRWPAGTKPIKITFNEGVLLPLPDLLDWARTFGRSPQGELGVPNVAPGRYQLCTGSICTSGTLAVGSSLVLDLTPLLPAATSK